MREPDIVVRWAGDEFAVLLVDATEPEARDVARRLVLAAADTIAVSAGIAQWNGNVTAAELLDRADKALLRNKRTKRLL